MIELTEEIKKQPKKKFSWIRCFFVCNMQLIKIGIILAVWIYLSIITTVAYLDAKKFVMNKFDEYKQATYKQLDVIERYKVAVAAEPNSVEQTINDEKLKAIVSKACEKYNVNPAVVFAMIEQEGGFRTDRVRFEQKWKDQYSRIWKQEKWTNDIEYQMLFSSIGILQIGYGLHREECGLTSFTDLLFADKNIDCGLKILRNCLDRNADIKSPSTRLKTCIKEYNGAGSMADQYLNAVWTKIDDYLIENSKVNIMVASSPKIRYTYNMR